MCPLQADPNSDRDAFVEIQEKYIGQAMAQEKAAMQQLMTATEATGVITYPNPSDVLVGRGYPYQAFPGNNKLLEIIEEEFLERYRETSHPFEKTCIHLEVVKAVEEVRGGRFIKRTPQGWEVVNETVARKKVSSCFRSRKAKGLSTGIVEKQ